MATTTQKYIYALFSIIVLLCSCEPLLVPQSGTQAYEEDANGHKYVDLGLSVKWAAYDIGAKSAAEHGSFFAWGETQPKDKYSWENYKYAAPYKSPESGTRSFGDGYGKVYELTKYNLDPNSEYYDGKTTLDLIDDAAHMAWGGNWRMPTVSECNELVEKCEWTWTEYLGVYGYDVKGPNGNRMFWPYYMEGIDMLSDRWLSRWSSNCLNNSDIHYNPDICAYMMTGGGEGEQIRSCGLFVRAVWGKNLPKFFILSFDANGGEGLMHPQQFNKDVLQSINAVRFTHESLNFVGWNTEPDGSGQSYANGEKITLSKDMTLYAQWALVTGSENGHDYVDLGLPSGLKWATCNVGATSPEGYGDYFAWGETEPKSNYDWSTYKYCNGSETSLTKYNTSSDYGTIDNKTTLELSDDAARANWGEAWRMPTDNEWHELKNNCTWKWTTQNGVNGYEVTSKTNGNSIFLPAASGRYVTSVGGVGSYGRYWTSSLYESEPNRAYGLGFNSGSVDWYVNYRSYGYTVRAVFSENDTPSTFVTLSFDANGGEGTMPAQTFEAGVSQAITANTFTRSGYAFTGWNTNADGSGTSYTDKQSITISQDMTLYAQWESAGGSGGGSSTSGTENGHDYVDLGLPSGLKWATCNVGATAPEGYGDYFAWGETEPKTNYDWSTYKYGSYYTMTKYCTQSSYGTVDNKTTLELSDDAARANWGGKWRMPTKAEQDELKNNCTWTWTTQNGVNGCRLTSKTNGNSIFLPAAGCRNVTSVEYVGSYGSYWSSSLDESDPHLAYTLYFDSGYVDWHSYYRRVGLTVRAVCP